MDKTPSTPLSTNTLSLFFFFFFVLYWGLNSGPAYTLSHSTSSVFVKGFSR
jgi:hypothetical protein